MKANSMLRHNYMKKIHSCLIEHSTSYQKIVVKEALMVAALPAGDVEALEGLAAVVHAHLGCDAAGVAWAHGADAAGEA